MLWSGHESLVIDVENKNMKYLFYISLLDVCDRADTLSVLQVVFYNTCTQTVR